MKVRCPESMALLTTTRSLDARAMADTFTLVAKVLTTGATVIGGVVETGVDSDVVDGAPTGAAVPAPEMMMAVGVTFVLAAMVITEVCAPRARGVNVVLNVHVAFGAMDPEEQVPPLAVKSPFVVMLEIFKLASPLFVRENCNGELDIPSDVSGNACNKVPTVYAAALSAVAGVFSAKYSKLSEFAMALVGFVPASPCDAACPYA